MNGQKPGGPVPEAPSQGFQQFSADAVCERCGTVNDEGALLCKACGQNLRDQRTRRLAGAKGTEALEEKVSRFRLLTGLLSAFGILLVVLAVLNLSNIEAGLVSVLSEERSAALSGTDWWTGQNAAIYEELLADLQNYPTSPELMQRALDDPATETAYNGRYILLPSGALDAGGVIGEAALRRRGNRVYFVALVGRFKTEVRGYAVLEQIAESGGEDAIERPVVRNTAGFISPEGVEVHGFGTTEPQAGGGHHVFAFTGGANPDQADRKFELFAYRIR
jgi:hypothetical protein